MKAVVLERVCTPKELQITEVPIPIVKPGWVLVKIRAFGINRSEMFTRQGHSPSVQFPRIIGIECVGEIEDPSDSTFIKGTTVASLMGGLGRAFDGSYAEYALIPSDQVYPIPSDMKWTELAAIPEMYYTAYASLFECLQLTSGEMLLIRGGTSSVGLAALQLAKSVGATVISTTRDKEKFALLRQAGADYALLDNEHLREQVYAIAPNRVNKVLELVGTTTVKESLQFISERGICCMSGILGDEWTLDAFEPLVDIPTGVYFTAFTSEVIKESTLISLFEHIQKHGIVPPIARVFTLEEIGKAHFLMESNTANGKIVISNDILETNDNFSAIKR
ncbi:MULTISPECIES: zinc-binding alcohol dehydrogenase family protein [Paenibacillus]|uniref:NADPH:quinone reductase-like Zn-dependent oxidoreductase n=1 Tax=Paenibacillus pabuli TaxID=1472 RepID=A0A855XVB5_9BACL|nr:MULTISPECIES: zinc-binding alcohol dehydrogenase family protein [Paenibacillus]PWW38890.1 NADPH:quinone reductase-like Zn-dependent oxidoreductase [Paenibacillus pabuli]PXW06075.1 NADPH:quinone reductase-like Zn-dependent oxidoreductase [Paenibacillus taichungensis]